MSESYKGIHIARRQIASAGSVPVRFAELEKTLVTIRSFFAGAILNDLQLANVATTIRNEIEKTSPVNLSHNRSADGNIHEFLFTSRAKGIIEANSVTGSARRHVYGITGYRILATKRSVLIETVTPGIDVTTYMLARCMNAEPGVQWTGKLREIDRGLYNMLGLASVWRRAAVLGLTRSVGVFLPYSEGALVGHMTTTGNVVADTSTKVRGTLVESRDLAPLAINAVLEDGVRKAMRVEIVSAIEDSRLKAGERALSEELMGFVATNRDGLERIRMGSLWRKGDLTWIRSQPELQEETGDLARDLALIVNRPDNRVAITLALTGRIPRQYRITSTWAVADHLTKAQEQAQVGGATRKTASESATSPVIGVASRKPRPSGRGGSNLLI